MRRRHLGYCSQAGVMYTGECLFEMRRHQDSLKRAFQQRFGTFEMRRHQESLKRAFQQRLGTYRLRFATVLDVVGGTTDWNSSFMVHLPVIQKKLIEYYPFNPSTDLQIDTSNVNFFYPMNLFRPKFNLQFRASVNLMAEKGGGWKSFIYRYKILEILYFVVSV